MPWVRFDDQFPINRKVKALNDATYRLHSEAIFWCARNLTDGYVAPEDLPELASARRPLKLLPVLLHRGLWHEATHVCDSSDCPGHPDHGRDGRTDGWLIHDYFEYQPTKEKVVRERAAKAERQRRWLEKQRTGRDASRDASQDGSKDAAPSPPRPEGRRGGGTRPGAAASGRADPSGPTIRGVPDWCGECREDTRLLEDDDGIPRRCPTCHPLRSEAS